MQRLGRERLNKVLQARELALKLERVDPLWHGWVAPVWVLSWALLDVPWVDPELAAAIRRNLGFQKPLRVLVANGANRAGKSRWAACTIGRYLWPTITPSMTPATVDRMKAFMERPRNTYCFQTTEKDSRDRQQPLLVEYMPPAIRAAACSKKGFKSGNVGDIRYSVKNGFPDSLFVTPDGSRCDFRNYAAYSHDPMSIEGIEADAIWADEPNQAELIKTLKGRITTRNGILVPTFTPIHGYTPAVRMFYASSRPVMESPAFLLPADGGEPDLEAAMYVEDLVWRALAEAPAP